MLVEQSRGRASPMSAPRALRARVARDLSPRRFPPRRLRFRLERQSAQSRPGRKKCVRQCLQRRIRQRGQEQPRHQVDADHLRPSKLPCRPAPRSAQRRFVCGVAHDLGVHRDKLLDVRALQDKRVPTRDPGRCASSRAERQRPRHRLRSSELGSKFGASCRAKRLGDCDLNFIALAAITGLSK